MKFHSPYQFIPIKACENKTGYKNRTDLESKTNTHVRHDRWTKEGYSGRINCTLKTVSPLVVGAKQDAGTQEEAGVVHPYQPKENPAIPANSLRGMIASIAETLSNSSLRVLDSEEKSTYIVQKIVKSNLYQAIERIADKDTLPWNKSRTQLTPAECLFGVVEEKPAADQPARNLASRIQFTDAIASNKIALLPSVILKILDSPKPPSPAMYFYSQHSKPISKKELDLEKHNPNGRKHYLPQPQEYNGKKVWQSKFTKENPPKPEQGKINWKQYLSCTPIPENAEFHFTIHFENLSQKELGLLQTAIQPTTKTADFIHRLGLGKPLGLGQINLSIDKTEIINRTERYSLKQLNQARYQSHTIAPDTSLIDTEILELVTTLYNPENVIAPVCYPFNEKDGQQPYNEGEGFSWFVTNDKLKKDNPKKQRLKPIKAHQAIPTLDSFDKD